MTLFAEETDKTHAHVEFAVQSHSKPTESFEFIVRMQSAERTKSDENTSTS